MSVRPDGYEDADDAERARLRRIGIWTIAAVVAVLVVITILLVGTSGGDSRDSVLVIGSGASVGSLNKGDTVRVTGQVRNALQGSRFGDRNDRNTLEATKIERTAAGGDTGTTPIKKVADNNGLRGDTVTVVGEVLNDTGGDLVTIAEPK